jgi:hypothetical protein
MRTKSLVSLLLIALVAGLLAAPAAQAKKKKKAPKGPVVVGVDEVGDWGCNVDCGLAPISAALGQDLVEASFNSPDKETLEFIIKLDALPPSGGVPEVSRYTWEFTVDGRAIQMSGGFTEYVRGTCNPTYNPLICPPPRDPGMAPFFLRVGGCTVGGACEEVGLVHGVFDAATATITIPVPLEVLEAKPGSEIGPGVSLLGGSVYAAPAAMVTNASLPSDNLIILDTYTIPKK